MKDIVVVISAKQGAGKTALSKWLIDELKKTGHFVIPEKFAHNVYALENMVYTYMRELGFDRPDDVAIKDGKLLQILANDWAKLRFGDYIWSDLLISRLKSKLPNKASQVFGVFRVRSVTVIDDMRFPEELKRLQESGLPIQLIRIEAPADVRKARCENWRKGSWKNFLSNLKRGQVSLQHFSEVALDKYFRENKKNGGIIYVDGKQSFEEVCGVVRTKLNERWNFAI
jgi:hypothetical protein